MPSRALVPRRSYGALYRYGAGLPAARRYMAAYKIARWAVKNRRGIKRVARRAYRTGRQVKAKMSKRTQPSVRQASKKRADAVWTGSADALSMGRLNISSLPYPVHTTDNDVNGRVSNTILTKGIKICRTFEYRGGSSIGPIMVNWALIQLKHDEPEVSWPTQIEEDFWRRYDGLQDKSANWSNYIATSIWDESYNCLPMNPSSDFKILTRKKFVLHRETGTGSAVATRRGAGPSIKKIERYFKVYKKQEFSRTTEGQPTNPILEIYWYNTLTPREWPLDPTSDTWIYTHKMNAVYFNNAVNCC